MEIPLARRPAADRTAEFAGLMQDYRGNYILAFAAYNAGRGRVREWVERFQFL